MLIDPYQFQPVRITHIVREAKHAVSVQLTMPEGYVFTYGQHAVVRITMPDGSRLVRQYSFSSAPSTNELWLTIVREPNGQVSGWFTETAAVGDIIELSHPFTGPLMQKIPRGEICMIAGGSGIAPILSFIGELRAHKKPFTLLYSTRSDERCFKQQLAPLVDENVTVRLTDVEPRLTGLEIQAKLSAESTVFICGSRDFVTDMKVLCETVSPHMAIYCESFTLS